LLATPLMHLVRPVPLVVLSALLVLATPRDSTADALTLTSTTFRVPTGEETYAHAINNLGQIVGTYGLGGNETHGYLYSGGTFTTIDVPNTSIYGMSLNAINDAGQIVGWVSDKVSGLSSFLYVGGAFIPIAIPGATYTQAYDINNFGQIVGYYSVGSVTHGFIQSGGVTTPIDFPGATSTVPVGINDQGQITGRSTMRPAPTVSFTRTACSRRSTCPAPRQRRPPASITRDRSSDRCAVPHFPT
jgi:probable HAF family extracellular repeat protein